MDGLGAWAAPNTDDAAAASVLGLRMMAADLTDDAAERDHAARLEAYDIVAGDLVEMVSIPEPGAALWRRELAARLASFPTRDRRIAVLEDVARHAERFVGTRAGQLAVLVELVTLEPWPVGIRWTGEGRARALRMVTDGFDRLGRRDLLHIEHELAAVTTWMRPGDAMDLDPHGAGTMAIPAPRGIGVASVWDPIAREASRAAVHTSVVVVGELGDTAGARDVMEHLRRRLDEVTIRLIMIATQLAEAPGSGAGHPLDRERRFAELAESALVAALDRLRGVRGDDAATRGTGP